MEAWKEVLQLARRNVATNPIFSDVTATEAGTRYLNGLKDEVTEVAAELRENNKVYLTDELSDILWDYTVLLALLEKHQLVDDVESVIKHSLHKYSERSAAFTEQDSQMWDTIKARQKQALQTKHQELYGD